MRQRIAAAVAGGLLVLGLAGCAGPSSLDSAASAGMQDSVVAVAQLAAKGDAAGATAQLDTLQSQLDAAVEGDLVTAARAARIQDAIDVVRADLAALVAPQPAPSPTESETAVVDDSGSGNTDGGGDDGGSGGDDNSGKGKNNGNENGNSGKGKGKGDG
jgi:hypothetical protein